MFHVTKVTNLVASHKYKLPSFLLSLRWSLNIFITQDPYQQIVGLEEKPNTKVLRAVYCPAVPLRLGKQGVRQVRDTGNRLENSSP